ncbi:hypothetical protein CDIK_3052 [Cucumispora dikerogammari]|nr:hypothetical protein CDIK_3052 [Cucumispora dikerogammari]
MDIQWNKLPLTCINKAIIVSTGLIKLNGITGIYGDETKTQLLKTIWKHLISTPKTNKFTTYKNETKQFKDFFIRTSISPRQNLNNDYILKIFENYFKIKNCFHPNINSFNVYLKIFSLETNILEKLFNELKENEKKIISLITELIKGNMIYFIEDIDSFLNFDQFRNLINFFIEENKLSPKTLCFTAKDINFSLFCDDVLVFSNGFVIHMFSKKVNKLSDEVLGSIELKESYKSNQENNKLSNEKANSIDSIELKEAYNSNQANNKLSNEKANSIELLKSNDNKSIDKDSKENNKLSNEKANSIELKTTYNSSKDLLKEKENIIQEITLSPISKVFENTNTLSYKETLSNKSYISNVKSKELNKSYISNVKSKELNNNLIDEKIINNSLKKEDDNEKTKKPENILLEQTECYSGIDNKTNNDNISENNNILLEKTYQKSVNTDNNNKKDMTSSPLIDLLKSKKYTEDHLKLSSETISKPKNCLIFFYKAIFLAKVYSITSKDFHQTYNPITTKILIKTFLKIKHHIKPIILWLLFTLIFLSSLPILLNLGIKNIIKNTLNPNTLVLLLSFYFLIFGYFVFSNYFILKYNSIENNYYDCLINFIPHTTRVQSLTMSLYIQNIIIILFIPLLCALITYPGLFCHYFILFSILYPQLMLFTHLSLLFNYPINFFSMIPLWLSIIFLPFIYLYYNPKGKSLIFYTFNPFLSNLNSFSAYLIQYILYKKIIKNETNSLKINDLIKLFDTYHLDSQIYKSFIGFQCALVMVLLFIFLFTFFKPFVFRL